MPLKEWARKQNRELHRKALEDRDSHLWHSGAYHDYFEGYTEYTETDAKGKKKVRRVYTGTWYRQDLVPYRYAGLRITYGILLLIMFAMIFLAGRSQGSAGTAFYVVIPEILTVCLLARMFYVLVVNYFFLPRKMTIHDYKASSGALKRASLWLCAGFSLDLVVTVLDMLIGGTSGRYTQAPLVILAFGIGALLSFFTHVIEKHVPYREEANDTAPIEGGVTIDNEKSQGIFQR